MEFIDLSNFQSKKLVEGVLLYPLRVNKDASGVLVETLRRDWPDIYGKGREFAMQYYSITPTGIARDENVWHTHQNQEDRFLVVKGEIITAVADNREDSPTKGLLNLFFMESDKTPYILLIPKQALHGFMVVSSEDAILLNFPTRLYNPRDEGRIPYGQARVRFPNGDLFNWEKVREEFKLNEH